MAMTGLYKQSVIERKRKARSDVAGLEKSLSRLKHTDSCYAQEHRALLELVKKVAAIYETAPNELTPNAKDEPYIGGV